MNIEKKTLRDLVTEMPEAAPILERLQIDYCCGGNQTLEEACVAARLDPGKVAAQLEAPPSFAAATAAKSPDWRIQPLSSLIWHILAAHHSYVKRELPRLEELIAKVCSAHAELHPELFKIQKVFGDLKQELEEHLQREERVLFPYVAIIEDFAQTRHAPPAAPFGGVQNPIQMMTLEHEHAGGALRAMRLASSNYSVPPEGCASYRALYRALEAFEHDLHQHIHLENNILFPRAIALEQEATSTSRA